MVAITCIIALLALAFAADSATIHVDWSGGGDYTSIQPALTAALGGDTILIVPGTYTGEDNRNLTLGPSKDLVIESESGLSTVTVDCQGQDRAFYLHSSGQSRDTVIRGLLFRNGYTDNYNGGGIILSGVDPIIEYCIFHGMEFRHDVHLACVVAFHEGPALAVDANLDFSSLTYSCSTETREGTSRAATTPPSWVTRSSAATTRTTSRSATNARVCAEQSMDQTHGIRGCGLLRPLRLRGHGDKLGPHQVSLSLGSTRAPHTH